MLPERLKAVAGVLVLSLSSSLDNFVVGASLGVNAEVATLSWSLNFIISACNALGALSSTGFGRALGARAPALAGLAAAAVFAYLAAGEVEAFFSGGGSALSRDAAAGKAWVVAVPMTLNNLAGGVAGGLAGYHAVAMFAGAFVASFSLMAAGFWLGRAGGAATGANPHIFAAAAFLFLCVSQLAETVREQRRHRRGSPPPTAVGYEMVGRGEDVS